MLRALSGGLAAAVVVTWAGLHAAPAAAHAIVVDSTPGVEATVPQEFDVRIRFNSRIDHRRSRLTVLGDGGTVKPVAIAGDSLPDLIAAHVTGLVPGSYRLRWQVLAVDGHITRGDIPFRVGE